MFDISDKKKNAIVSLIANRITGGQSLLDSFKTLNRWKQIQKLLRKYQGALKTPSHMRDAESLELICYWIQQDLLDDLILEVDEIVPMDLIEPYGRIKEVVKDQKPSRLIMEKALRDVIGKEKLQVLVDVFDILLSE